MEEGGVYAGGEYILRFFGIGWGRRVVWVDLGLFEGSVERGLVERVV